MARIDADTVAAEDALQFTGNAAARGLDTVVREHVADAVGVDVVRVDDVLVLPHGLQVDTGREDVGDLGLGRCFVIDDAGGQARDGLHKGLAGAGLDEVQHEDLGGVGVVFHCEAAAGASAVVEAEGDDVVGGLATLDAVFAVLGEGLEALARVFGLRAGAWATAVRLVF